MHRINISHYYCGTSPLKIMVKKKIFMEYLGFGEVLNKTANDVD